MAPGRRKELKAMYRVDGTRATRKITLRVSQEELELIRQAATSQELSVNYYIVVAMLDRSHDVLRTKHQIKEMKQLNGLTTEMARRQALPGGEDQGDSAEGGRDPSR